MKRLNALLYIFLLASITVGCKGEKEDQIESTSSQKKELIVREQSEMSALMLQMYAFNEQLKEQIIAGDEILLFPQQFMIIQEAELTEGKVRGDDFSQLSINYLEAQRTIHDSNVDKKEAFNKMVSSCVDCHKQKCTGPIPKIEKLYIDVN